jgi:hypothetical protein
MACRLDPSLLMELAGLRPDPWQRRALRSTARRALILAARQTGKSECVSIIALREAIFNPGSLVLLVSRSARQSLELFRRVTVNYERMGRPVECVKLLASSLTLRGGSRILALPGKPETIRCFTPDMVVIDEAALCVDAVYTSLLPMLGASGGSLWAISTPFGMRGTFFSFWSGGDPLWERHKSVATECPRISESFIEEQRRTLGQIMFEQEMLCEFKNAIGQCFSTASIESAFRDIPALSGF